MAAVKSNVNVRLTVRESVTRDDLIKSLDKLLKRYGCPGCGLNGWGMILHAEVLEARKLREELMGDMKGAIINVEELAAGQMRA